MNELFDKLFLRVLFALFICFVVYLYKYAHTVFYPSARNQMFKMFYPEKNPSDTIHLFSRLIGIGIIFSEFYFDLSDGFFFALFDFFIEAIIVCFMYLSSIYILESIVLYNFEYQDEIIKKKSYAYAIICFAHSICLAILIKTIAFVVKDSVILLFFLWLFAMVLLGFASKSFKVLSKLSLNKLLVQMNLGVAISYLGFIFGWTVLIASAINHPLLDIKWFSIQVILKIILSLIILPIFTKGIVFIFKIQDSFDGDNNLEKNSNVTTINIGHGVYEGAIFFTSCYLTSVITGHIHFGTFYPVS